MHFNKGGCFNRQVPDVGAVAANKRKKLYERVLKRITPGRAEYAGEMGIADEIAGRIRSIEGSHTEVVLVGSLSRNTHLKGDRDIDVFVLFPEKLTREEFEREGLRIGKKVFRGHSWEKAYAEHPYIRGNIRGYDVEIVPSYQVSKAELLKSAVDRSPFHAQWLKGRLKDGQKQEVRLLRQWLKGIKCYGADIRASSVPGYVVELLVIKYGSFEKAVRAMAKWQRQEVIDLGGHHARGEALKKFDSHLVVVDPVDRNRNVAAALGVTQYSRMIAAARAFLRKPDMAFFFGRKAKPLQVKKVRGLLGKKELVAVEIGYPKGVLADIMWGQLRRMRKKVVHQLERGGFDVLRSDEWTDEHEHMVVVLELGSLVLQRSEKRVGPEVASAEHSARFLGSHKKLIAGPRIEKGRWVIEVERRHADVRKLLAEFLKKEKRVEKAQLKRGMNKRCKILDEEKLVGFYRRSAPFREFFSNYLHGREEFEII